MTFTNRFGYSISRESMFDECPRRYYFHYYLSWRGWERTAPAVVREAFKLKRLVSTALWRGQLVHYIASKVLQSMKVKGRVPDRGDVTSYMLDLFRKQLTFSSSGRYLSEPKKRGNRLRIEWLALFEHEYRIDIPDERIEQAKRECIECIENLFECSILDRIGGSDPASWTIEDLDHAEFSQSFMLDGVKIFAKTDFMYRGNDGTFNIIDWKTNRRTGSGSAGRARVQLGIYAFHAREMLGQSLETIRLYEVNLLQGGRIIEHAADEEALEAASDHIRSGIDKLSSRLVDRDMGRNEPLSPAHFPTVENKRCRTCNFYRICKEPHSPITF